MRCDLSRLLCWKITKRIHSSKPALLNHPIGLTLFVEKEQQLWAHPDPGQWWFYDCCHPAEPLQLHHDLCKRWNTVKKNLLTLHRNCTKTIQSAQYWTTRWVRLATNQHWYIQSMCVVKTVFSHIRHCSQLMFKEQHYFKIWQHQSAIHTWPNKQAGTMTRWRTNGPNPPESIQ